MNDTTRPPTGAADPAAARAQIALRAALAMLVPLARWLVRNGVPYASFAPALKSVFLEAARRELAAHGGKITDSALSVLSGVHRRDIRAMGGEASAAAAQPKTPSVASQLFTRWLTDPRLRGGGGRAKALPKSGDGASFDTLAREVSSDVHPRTLLAEMQRLGLVHLADDDTVHLDAQAFVPQQGFEDMVELFSANVADHVAAAAHNISGNGGDKFLEQSVFASGLSRRSTEALGALARTLWQPAFERMVREASQRLKQDVKAHDTPMRLRFGVYYYAEPQVAEANAALSPATRAPSGAARSTSKRRRRAASTRSTPTRQGSTR